MDYEKKYKEALELARDYYKANLKLYKADENVVLEDIFPELKESEDERILEIIKHCIESRYLHTSTIKGISQKQCFAWLDKQSEQKPVWSKEDESIALGIEQLCNCASLLNIAPDKIDKIRTWLKSLKERYTWKPSDEQMEVLLGEAAAWTKGCPKQKILESLYNDLKKLTE